MKPPAIFRAVLSACLHPSDRRFALADLHEELERRAASDGAAAARRWYRRQCRASVLPALRDRWARRAPFPLARVLDDARYALRSLAKTPVVAVVTIASMAVGIGATTAVFSAANAFLFKAPSAAMDRPERLATVFTTDTGGGRFGRNSYLDFRDMSGQLEAFEDLAAHRLALVELRGDGEPARAMVEIVSGNYFDVLGVEMPLGRDFLPRETRFGEAERVIVIGHRLWQREFGGDPAAVGATIDVDGHPFVVIGVAPEDLTSRFLALRVEAWVPLGIPGGVFLSTDAELSNRSDRNYGVVARLRDGVDLARAQAWADVVAARQHAAYPEHWSDELGRPRVMTVADEKASRVPPDAFAAMTATSGVLVAAAGLILAVACFNVGGIMTARADQRRREMAVRLALGARRGRLTALLLTETLILALAACALGVAFAAWLVRRFDSVQLPIGNFFLEFDVPVDGTVLAFAVTMAVATSLLFGLAPAARGARPDLVASLKGLPEHAEGRRRLDVRSLLVLGQVAVALIFVVGSAIALRSFGELVRMEWGIDPTGVGVVSRDFRDELDDASLLAEYRAMRRRVAEQPEIVDAEISRVVEGTMFAFDARADVEVDGYEPAEGESMRLPFNAVTPGYVSMMGIRILRGRGFTESDGPEDAPVAIVNAAFARRYFPGRDGLGESFRIVSRHDERDAVMSADGSRFEVVGIAADARYEGFENTGEAFFWVPLYQRPAHRVMLVARGRDPAAVPVAVLRAEVDPERRDLVLVPPGPLDELLEFQFAFLRVIGRLLAAAGAFGLVLAMTGLYGIVSFAVARRTRELAIRQAVGARPGQVVGVVFREGLRLAAWGLVVGLVVAVPVSALLRADIEGVSPLEPVAVVLASALILVATAMASYLPARRVSRIQPVESLKAE